MPSLTRWFVRTSLLYFVAALLVGVTMAARGIVNVPSVVTRLRPIYLHLFMVGWVAQLIFGVAHWMFPTYSKERPRGSVRLAWATYVLLNVGLILRAVAEPLNVPQAGAGWGWLLALSAVLQWLAGLAFAVNTWGRVKGK